MPYFKKDYQPMTWFWSKVEKGIFLCEDMKALVERGGGPKQPHNKISLTMAHIQWIKPIF